MKKTQKSELTIQSSDSKTRQIETLVFSRRPFVGDLFRVTRTRTTFGPQLPIMAEDTLARETVLEALPDDALARLTAQLELEIPLLSNPDLRRWLLHVAKKIGIGGALTLTRDDGAKLLALVRCAVGLDDLLRALREKDYPRVRRLQSLYEAKPAKTTAKRKKAKA
jgi:hypothetical protein